MSKPTSEKFLRMRLGQGAAEGATGTARDSGSRRIRQRVQRARRVEKGTVDLEKGLAELAGGPDLRHVLRNSPTGPPISGP